MIDPNMEADQLCSWLFEQNAKVALHWLYEIWEGPRQAPEQFNWLGLAEISPNLASKQDDLDWARVAVLVNTFLISEARTCGHVFWSARVVPPEQRVWSCSSFEERILTIRTRFLLKQGMLPGDPVLDTSLFTQAFFAGLTLSLEEACKYFLVGRKELSREQSGQLRRIKYHLGYWHQLAERSLLPQELWPWYSLRERLHVL